MNEEKKPLMSPGVNATEVNVCEVKPRASGGCNCGAGCMCGTTTTASSNVYQTFDMTQQQIPVWNPTKPDVPNPDNEYIAQKIMGLVPCDGWHYVNFGSAGGAALMNNKNCTHERGKCYPSMTTGNMNGKVGGCPEYDKHPQAFKELIAHWIQNGNFVSLSITPRGVDAWITSECGHGNKVVCPAETLEQALVKASIEYHKKYIA